MIGGVGAESARGEEFGEFGEAVFEDLFDVALDEEAVDEGGEDPALGFVEDLVFAEGFGVVVDGFEGVGVVPELVGAGVLGVDELVRGVPVEDGCFPADGESADVEFVADLGAVVHVDGFGGEDVELEEGGGELLEVVRVGEEGEDGLDGVVEDLGGSDAPDAPVFGVGRRFDGDIGCGGHGGDIGDGGGLDSGNRGVGESGMGEGAK